MAVDNELQNQNMALLNPNRRVVRQGIPLRRRKLPSVRLGGKKPRRALARMFRRIRLRWLKLQYMCMMRKLKEFYRNLIKDMAGGGGGPFQQRIFLESSFAVPVVGISLSTYPSLPGSDRPRTLGM
ncbi:uncharacterized protein LOC21391549 [Morus notabilis]|uniref:uncharacterized protein LOC21391549 n=1 Tax=Morus notabilis TaxID=981085 RepID=UPI000CED0DE5|nr:uncharacterized protein LOC21391549 [Morus notabilis]